MHGTTSAPVLASAPAPLLPLVHTQPRGFPVATALSIASGLSDHTSAAALSRPNSLQNERSEISWNSVAKGDKGSVDMYARARQQGGTEQQEQQAPRHCQPKGAAGAGAADLCEVQPRRCSEKYLRNELMMSMLHQTEAGLLKTLRDPGPGVKWFIQESKASSESILAFIDVLNSTQPLFEHNIVDVLPCLGVNRGDGSKTYKYPRVRLHVLHTTPAEVLHALPSTSDLQALQEWRAVSRSKREASTACRISLPLQTEVGSRETVVVQPNCSQVLRYMLFGSGVRDPGVRKQVNRTMRQCSWFGTKGCCVPGHFV